MLPSLRLIDLTNPGKPGAALWITCGDLCYEVVMKPPKNLPQMSVGCDRVLVSQKKEGINGQDVCLLRERVH